MKKYFDLLKEKFLSDRKWQITAAAVVITLLIYMIVRFFGARISMILHMLQRGSREEIAEYLNSKGSIGALVAVFLFSVVQVISIFIPGMAIQLAAGLILGWPKAFICTYLGFVIGNLAVFQTARKLGSRISSLLESNAEVNRLAAKINEGSPAFVTGMSFLVPGVPNGLVPYVAATTSITWFRFMEAVTVTSWIQILSNCIAGHFLIRGQYLFMAVSLMVQVLVIVFCALNRDLVLKWGRKIL